MMIQSQFNVDMFTLSPLGPYSVLGSGTDNSAPQSQPKRKRSWSRAVFSNLQRKGLEKRFEVQKYVTKPDRRQVAAMLGLTDAQVYTFTIIELLFGFVDAVFVAPRSEELGIAA